ncbi:MAG: hypothetical protein R6X22_07705, partial [Gemmatimonadota bacterium]
MQIARSREHAQAFRLGAWDLERLVQVLGGDAKVTRIAVELADGSTIGVSNAREILEIPNAAGRSIEGITIESAPSAFLATPDDPPRLILVRLRDRVRGPISYHVSGDERAVERLAGALDDWCASVTPWYGDLATATRMLLAFRSVVALGGIALFVLAVHVLAGGAAWPAAAAGSPAVLAARTAAAGALVLLSGAVLVANLRRATLFPVAQ